MNGIMCYMVTVCYCKVGGNCDNCSTSHFHFMLFTLCKQCFSISG